MREKYYLIVLILFIFINCNVTADNTSDLYTGIWKFYDKEENVQFEKYLAIQRIEDKYFIIVINFINPTMNDILIGKIENKTLIAENKEKKKYLITFDKEKNIIYFQNKELAGEGYANLYSKIDKELFEIIQKDFK